MNTWNDKWRRACERGDGRLLQRLTKDILFDVEPEAYVSTYVSKVIEALAYPQVLASDRLEVFLTTAVNDLSSEGTIPVPLLDAFERFFSQMADWDARFGTAVYIRENSAPQEAIRRLIRLVDLSPADADMLIFEIATAINYLDSELLEKLEKAGPLPKDKAGWIERVREFVR
jgi:hypothetical protein